MLLSLALLSKHRFNRARLNENDFYQLCEERGITVLEEDVSTSFYFWVHGKEFIVIDKKLKGLEREFACWHELSHAYLSARITQPPVAYFHGLVDSKEETQADAFACIALIPLPLIDDHSVLDECSEVAKWIFERRRRIYELYHLCLTFLALSFFP